MAADGKISRIAMGDPTFVPVFEAANVPNTLNQDERMNEELPFGSRGGIAISHHFPLDGEYVIKIGLQRTLYGYIIGLGRPHQLELRLNNKLIKRFTVGGDAPPAPAPAT